MNLTKIVQTAIDMGRISYSLSTGDYIVDTHGVSRNVKKVFHLTDEIVADYIKENAVMLSTGDNYLHIEQIGAKWLMSVKDMSIIIKIVKGAKGLLRMNCSRDGVNLLDLLDCMASYKDVIGLMNHLDTSGLMAYAKIGTKYHPLGFITKETFVNFLKTKI